MYISSSSFFCSGAMVHSYQAYTATCFAQMMCTLAPFSSRELSDQHSSVPCNSFTSGKCRFKNNFRCDPQASVEKLGGEEGGFSFTLQPLTALWSTCSSARVLFVTERSSGVVKHAGIHRESTHKSAGLNTCDFVSSMGTLCGSGGNGPVAAGVWGSCEWYVILLHIIRRCSLFGQALMLLLQCLSRQSNVRVGH